MTRYIDADALKESIDEHVYLVNHGFNESEYGITQYGIHQIIDDAPTIDAEPVRHGKWRFVKCATGLRSQCNECLHWVDAGTDRNYCPNCGARMDEEND